MKSVRVVEGVSHYAAKYIPRPAMREGAVRIRAGLALIAASHRSFALPRQLFRA